MASAPEEAPSVLIFRKRLLPYSETFIAAQGYALRRFRPVFTGFHIDKRGLHHLKREDCEPLAERRWLAELRRWDMRRGGSPPHGWLERLRRHRPALIHAHFGGDGHAAVPLAEALQLPLIVTFHGHDVLGAGDGQQRRNQELFQRMTAGIAVSRFIEQELLRAGCPPEKLVQHYIGIDTRRFFPEGPRAPEPTVLFVGRLVESKGCRHAIDAAATAQAAVPGLRLIVVGDGPLRQELEQYARGRLRNFEFTGPIPPQAVRQLMQQAWVLCGPRLTLQSGYAEALGMVFLEAQACGLPIVGYRNGGVEETVLQERTGSLCAEGDVGTLADMLRRLLCDSAQRASMSRCATDHARERFDLHRQTATLEQLYEQWRKKEPLAQAPQGASV